MQRRQCTPTHTHTHTLCCSATDTSPTVALDTPWAHRLLCAVRNARVLLQQQSWDRKDRRTSQGSSAC
jgi:hypothetical protein